ncbi:nuclear transport factor 2 family protein [Ensifer adhaerens]|uniref:nuclear transport factor 2 family protein n=1 Tax=Ensifer adhaerens TaxID=106592 RepID=UPI0023A927B2|nr:nuclear transport factor 2 family protein [Ensifer adhaerens]WDZ77474.1 nuclear transport factor 2 family protein [Ensifer adhaerens]
MSFDPSTQAIRYHAAINALDFAAIEAAFAEDARYISNGVGALVGRTAIISAFRDYFVTYPDQIARDSLIETLSPTSARTKWQLTATNATTGKRIERTGIEHLQFDDQGRIVAIEVYDD